MGNSTGSQETLYWELETRIGGLLCIGLTPFCNMFVVNTRTTSSMHYKNDLCNFKNY